MSQAEEELEESTFYNITQDSNRSFVNLDQEEENENYILKKKNMEELLKLFFIKYPKFHYY